METMYQITLRTHREGVKSNSQIYFMYCKGVGLERDVLSSLCRQSFVTKQLLQEDILRESVFPDDFKSEIEISDQYGNYSFIDDNEFVEDFVEKKVKTEEKEYLIPLK